MKLYVSSNPPFESEQPPYKDVARVDFGISQKLHHCRFVRRRRGHIRAAVLLRGAESEDGDNAGTSLQGFWNVSEGRKADIRRGRGCRLLETTMRGKYRLRITYVNLTCDYGSAADTVA